jgi:hypothetical protein
MANVSTIQSCPHATNIIAIITQYPNMGRAGHTIIVLTSVVLIADGTKSAPEVTPN